MEKIKDKIPEIAKKNNVKLILSKWELFYHDESLEIIDITDQIVNLFT
jgi:Skp family chaperone for outer membrane proteins